MQDLGTQCLDWQKVTAREGDDGLVRGFVPLDGRIGFCFEVLTCEQAVKYPHAVKVESVLVGSEVLKKLRQGFARSKSPKFLFPFRNLSPNLFVGSERMLKSRAYVASVDTCDHGCIRFLTDLCQAPSKSCFS